MRNRIERDLGIELSPSLIFDYPTLADLLEHLLSDHLGVRAQAVEESSMAALPDREASLGSADALVAPDRLLAELEASLRSLESELES
jgi:hypothetical protein